MKFRLLDKITYWKPYDRIGGIKTVSFEEYCLKEAFGEPPRLPESLLLESFLQLGNWLIMLSSDFREMGIAVRLSSVSFRKFLLPGEQLQLEVRLQRRHEDGFEFAGEGSVAGVTVISGFGCVAASARLAEYCDPENLRVLFGEIYEPLGTPAFGSKAALNPIVTRNAGARP